MLAYFTVTGGIASTAQKVAIDVRAQASLNLTKLQMHVEDLKITLILQKGRFFG